MTGTFLSSLTLLSALLPASALVAQSAPPVLTAETRSAVVDAVVAQLARGYVDADTGRLIGERVRSRHGAGAYDRLENPAQFAEAVTQDLRSLNHDLHLGLRYTPAASSAAGVQPASGPDPRRINFGLGRAEILDGNVGYLEITGFAGAPGYQDAVVDALRFLSRTDAMVIDVRRNGGGSSEMSHLVFSHFLGKEPVRTIDVRRRSATEPVRRSSLAEVPGPRRADVPLFVLTSQGTASAAEEFTFVLKNLHRATIVGSRTAGAGHMVNGFPVGNGFTLSLSITRVSDPVSGKEWEQVGVQPDVAVAPDRALVEAHALALKAVIPGVVDAGSARALTRLLTTLEARRRTELPNPGSIGRLAGEYEGRVVTVAGGRVYLTRRAGGLPEELTWLGGTHFALGATQYLFEEASGRFRVTVEQADGSRVTFQRAPPPSG